jgi:predicted Fe-Mo cluster-binding NifX family protein
MNKKIVFTVKEQNGLNSPVDQRFGRAPFFAVTDKDGTVIEQLANPSVDAGHGAGTGTAALMGNMEITDVVSGSFGPKAFSALDTMGITMWLLDESIKTAEDALKKLNAGELKKMEIKVY